MDMYTFDLMNQRLSECFGIQYTPIPYEDIIINKSSIIGGFKGLSHTPESKQKIAQSRTGNTGGFKNKTHTPEVRLKIVNANVIRSKNWLIIGPNGVKTNTNRLKDFCSANGLNYTSILNNKRYKGWTLVKI